MMQHCTVCGNRLEACLPEVTDPVSGELFAVWTCSFCGLGQTIPPPDDVGRYYGAVYYGNRHSFTASFCLRRRLRLVARAVGKKPGAALLDVGCGDGSFLLAAREAGWQVSGVEIHPEPARAAGLTVETALDQLPKTARFDCITLWHSLEHFCDVRVTLHELSKRLTAGGRLIVAVPDNSGWQARLFRRHWLHLDVPRHLFHFDRRSLSFALTQAGFQPEQFWHQELEYDWLGWSQSWMNCFFPIPNFFFHELAGKPVPTSRRMKVRGWVTGLVLTALTLPAQLAGTLFQRGGTLIIASALSGGGSNQTRSL